ncbi:MAG: hypothetical protein HYU69_13440 [Bacteroidetes bacterium]|nr:hypothetical protein [Bacteroidota bacterium]
MQETINYRVYRKTLFSTALCMLAGMSVRRLFLIAALFIACNAELYSQTCTGCTITVSTVDGGTYTITTGQKLCVTSTGLLQGTITLNGGTICNEGVVHPSAFTFTDGTFNNYGQLKYDGILLVSNSSVLNNYNDGVIRLSNSLIVAPGAKYFSPYATAQLIITPCAAGIVASAGADINISAGTPATIGGSPTASHGTAPYTYSWSPSAGLSSTTVANPVANPDSGIIYAVTVFDAFGCSGSDSVIVNINSHLIPDAGAHKTICSGSSVRLGKTPAVFGGVAPYTFSWSPSTGLSSTTVSNPVASPTSTTTYTLTITDTHGTTGTSTIAITVLSLPTVNAGTAQTVCSGTAANLGGSPTASGGVSPYKYLWSPIDSLSNDTIANPTANPSVTTTYSVLVVDSNNCMASSAVIITVKPERIAFAGDDIKIFKRDSATLGGSPTASYGVPPYTYSWSPTTALSSSTVANPKASPSVKTTYVLTLSDASGCTAFTVRDTVIVNVDSLPFADAGQDYTICLHDSVTLGGSPAGKGATLPLTYSWSPSTGLSSASIANPKASPSDTTTYVLTVTGADSYTQKDTVIVNVNPVPTAHAGNDTTSYSLDFVLGPTIVATGGTSPYSYNWFIAGDASVGEVANPLVRLTDTTTFFLMVTDSNSCHALDTVIINFNNIFGSLKNLDSCTWTISGIDSANYTVGSGQKLCIRTSGIARGTITLNSGGKIANSGKFEPASFVFNGGKFYNNITDDSTGVVRITGNLTLVDSCHLLNDGIVEVTGNFTENSVSIIDNTGIIEAQGNMTVDASTFNNDGVVTLNTTDFTITDSTSAINNYGTFRGIDSLMNSATLNMGDNALIFTKNFFNYTSGIVQKISDSTSTFGGIMVCTRTENYGNINDSIDICDKSPSAGPVYLDVNSGTVQSTVTYCQTLGVLQDSSEVCGSCPTLAIENSGCAGDLVTFTAVSTKTFDNYEFFQNNVRVQNGPESVYSLLVPAVLADTFTVIGTSYNSPCKKIFGDTIIIQSRPTVSLPNDTIVVADSIVLTASGASTYQWAIVGDTISGTGSTFKVGPVITTSYIVYGINSGGCVDTAIIEVRKPIHINYETESPTYFLPYSGAIDLTITGGQFPFSFLWSTGSTEAGLSSIVSGVYHVTVTDADGLVDSADIELGYAADWTTTGASSTGNSVTRTASGSGWGAAGSVSSNVISSNQDGWAEFVVGSTGVSYMFGLGTGNNNGGYAGINYAINMDAGTLKIYESGTLISTVGSCVSGDVIRVERTGSSIKYVKNGTTLYTSSTDASLTLMINTAIYTSGASITAIQGGFTDYPAAAQQAMIGSGVQALCTGDQTKNYTHIVNYDENGNVIGEAKAYFDYLGRETQSQARLMTENDIIATQKIYDLYGRPVVQSLPAPIGQGDFCFKPNYFFTNASGANYSNNDFNIANYTKYPNRINPGETDRPNPVGNTIPNSLGWYYSNNNYSEAYVPASAYPYTRVEYDDNNLGAVRRGTSAGELLNMGSGHETQTYRMPALNESDYFYGKDLGWIVEDYSDPSSNGQGTITPADLASNSHMIKTISVDENGQETVVFTDTEGKPLASCLSGQVNGANANVMSLSVTSVGSWFVDVHLPKGCENSLVITNPASYNSYTILNLKTGTFVKFGSSTTFNGTTPNLQPGFYRIMFKSSATSGRDGFKPTIAFTQDVNYYNFTINYYDKAGRLKLTVPPAGADEDYTPATNTVPDHLLIASTNYNSLGQVTSSVTPDAGKTEYLYRTDGQLRYSKNARQRASNASSNNQKFSYINYDDLGRVTETGEYNPLAGGQSYTIYFDQSFVTTNPDPAGCTQQTYIAYTASDAPPLSYEQNHMAGKVAKTWNAASSTWYSYDELGRISWTVQEIIDMPSGTDAVKTINYEYDFNGNVTEVAYQKEETGEDFYHYYEYDADKRLKKVFTSTDAGTTKREQSEYVYYKHGPLKRVQLANKLQGVDYVYTINGWLKSINNPELNERDPGKDGTTAGTSHSPEDLFGTTLDYFAGDYSRQGTFIQTYDTPDMYSGPPVAELAKNLYNGIIKDQRWKTVIPSGAGSIQYSSDQLMTAYLYDNKYQLTSSIFGTITSPGNLNKAYSNAVGGPGSAYGYQGPVFNDVDDYKVWGLTYDPNGNIKTLNRNGYTAHAGGLNMDQLTYGYSTTGGSPPRLLSNQLRNVVDGHTSTNSTLYNTFGFEPGQSGASANYVYDETGQQTEDNSAVAHGNLKSFNDYDVYGKVTAVWSNSAKTALRGRFTYDDKGFRMKKSDDITDTWYIRDGSGNVMSTYEKPTSGGSIAQKELGLFGDKRLGIYDASAGTYLYELTDQLGNVRSTFASATQTTVTTKFDGTEADDYLFTYNTNIDYTENHSSPANKTASVKLPQKSYGTGIFNTPVNSGQTVSGSYWYKVTGGTPDAMLVFALNDATTNQLLTWQPEPVGSSTTWAQVTFTYTVSANGLLNIYPWNNDATQTVWFDDLTLNFSGTGAGIAKAEAQSMADYYAHGSLMPGRNYFGSPAYRYGYQGQFAEKDLETGKNSFELRNWDALLGRWSTIDPYGQHHSPYMGMSNNPINFVDPNGGEDYENDDIIVRDMKGNELSRTKTDDNFDLIYVVDSRGVEFSHWFTDEWSPLEYKPTAFQQSMYACVDAFEEALFDLTLNAASAGLEAAATKYLFKGIKAAWAASRLVNGGVNATKVLNSASSVYKGTTILGHALSKHAGRNPSIWGKLVGNPSTWHNQALKHFNDIMNASGKFVEKINPQGIKFLEKMLPDGRGMRLNLDGTFKGFID